MPSDEFVSKQHVICIHGTGAGTPDALSPRWWEAGSAFCRMLAERLGSTFLIAEPFLWSGSNSERDRRMAGDALLTRLADLDKKGVRYHLIGHSHGGSVIWHALVSSSRNDKRCSGLGSWISVGTPFLHFRPKSTYSSVLRCILALAVASIAYPLFSGIMADPGAVWRNTRPWMLTCAATLFVCLTIVVVIAVSRVASLGLLWLRQSRRNSDTARAVEWYGQDWMGLWHASDEAIAALRATMAKPFALTPRLTSRNRLVRAGFWFYNSCVARVGDEFAWTRLIRRVQGSDLPLEAMTAADAFPAAMSPGSLPVPDPMSSAILSSADQKAALFLAGLRANLTHLHTAVDSNVALGWIATSISWKEVVHTSYFDDGELADQIRCRLSRDGECQSGIGSRLQRTEVSAPKATTQRTIALNIAELIGYALASVTLAAGFSLMEPSLVSVTQRGVESTIVGQLSLPTLNEGDATGFLFADVLLKADLIDHGDFSLPTNWAAHSNMVGMLRYYAFQLGRASQERQDQWTDLLTIAKKLHQIDEARIYNNLGRLDVGLKPDPSTRSIESFDPDDEKTYDGKESKRVFFWTADHIALLASTAPYEEVSNVVGLLQKAGGRLCSLIADKEPHVNLLVRLGRFGSAEGVRAIAEHCETEDERRLALIIGAWAASEGGHADAARALAADIVSVGLPPEQDDYLLWQSTILASEAGLPGYATLVDALGDHWLAHSVEIEAMDGGVGRLVRALRQIDPTRAHAVADVALPQMASAVMSEATTATVARIAGQIVGIAVDLKEAHRLGPMADEFIRQWRASPHPTDNPRGLVAAITLYERIAPDRARALASSLPGLARVSGRDEIDPGDVLDQLLRYGMSLDDNRKVAERIASGLPDSDMRDREIGSISRTFARNGRFYEAQTIADLASTHFTRLLCYDYIVNEMLRWKRPDLWEAYVIKPHTLEARMEQ